MTDEKKPEGDFIFRDEDYKGATIGKFLNPFGMTASEVERERLLEECGELHELVPGIGTSKMHSCRHQQGVMTIDPSLLRKRTVRLSPVTKWRRES